MESSTSTRGTRSSAGLFLPTLAVLTLIGLGLTLYSAVSRKALTSGHWSSDIAIALMYLALFFYAVRGYKIPHGNLLRYCFLLFALTDGALLVIGLAQNDYELPALCLNLLCVILAAYMAGRLHKFSKNRVLMIVVGVLLAACVFLAVLQPATGARPASPYTPVVGIEPQPAPAPRSAPAPDLQVDSSPIPADTDPVPPASAPSAKAVMTEAPPVSERVMPLLKAGINELVLWLCLCTAYIIRFREHRDAGLNEK